MIFIYQLSKDQYCTSDSTTMSTILQGLLLAALVALSSAAISKSNSSSYGSYIIVLRDFQDLTYSKVAASMYRSAHSANRTAVNMFLRRYSSVPASHAHRSSLSYVGAHSSLSIGFVAVLNDRAVEVVSKSDLSFISGSYESSILLL